MTEKRVLLAALISSLFLAWYAQAVIRPKTKSASSQISTHAQPQQSTSTLQQTGIQVDKISPLEKEEIVTIESDALAVDVGVATGAVHRVTLKKFRDSAKVEALTFHTGLPLIRLEPATQLTWNLQDHSQNSVALVSSDAKGNSYHISYTIDNVNSFVIIVLDIDYKQTNIPQETSVSTIYSWTQGDTVDGRTSPLEAILLEAGSGKLRHRRIHAVANGEKTVPRGTKIVSLSERYFCQSARWDGAPVSVRVLAAPHRSILVESGAKIATSGTAARYSGTIYFGPRDYFELKQAGFEDAFPIGALGKIGLLLLLVLSWIASLTHNYGVAIVLFSALVTCMTAPFTLMSFRSMKKMQELKPHMDKLMAKHKDDPQKANKEVMELYRAHKVSPISGCLPMLLQMPIFIALFQALSHFIRLRGQPFLWIGDLSMPDRLMRLSFSLPVLGNELNLLPILMAAAMYAQTKISQQASAQTDANPTTKMMSGPFMSIIFGVMFYHIPSGLVLYWLTNSLMSMVWYRVAK